VEASTPFNQDFYGAMQPGMRRSAEALVPIAIELIEPRSVVDVGCARGDWLKVFAEHGVADVFGIDGEHTEREQLQIPPERFQAVELSEPFSLERRFDLAVSLEVAEHLPESSADGFIASLAALAPAVLFSAAIPRQAGFYHINEQWPGYWAERFERHGFACIDCIRPRIWDREEIQAWYAQNTLLFVTSELLEAREALRAEHDRSGGPPMPIVHPRVWERQNPVGNLRRLQRWGIVTEEEIQSKRDVIAEWERKRAQFGDPAA
jgi:SAM-dependent methyltransferase